jgi:hypothetical protein
MWIAWRPHYHSPLHPHHPPPSLHLSPTTRYALLPAPHPKKNADITSASTPPSHGAVRTTLTPAFAPKAVRKQIPVAVAGYTAADLWITNRAIILIYTRLLCILMSRRRARRGQLLLRPQRYRVRRLRSQRRRLIR